MHEYLKSIEVQGYAKGTIDHMRHTLEAFEIFLQTSDITADTVRAFQKTFLKYGPETIAHKSSYLRSFLRWMYQNHHLHEDLSTIIKPVRLPRRIIKRVLTREEIAKFMLLPDITTPKGIRDRAILELVYSSALRREEVTRIELYDIDMKAGQVKITGKGDKQRMVPVGRIALYWIHRYIKDVRPSVRSKALFLHSRRGAISKSSIGIIFKKYSKQSGQKIPPHALRHASATHMLQNGASSRVVQAFLGHSQLMTTQMYTHVLTADLRGMIDRYHPRERLDAAP